MAECVLDRIAVAHALSCRAHLGARKCRRPGCFKYKLAIQYAWTHVGCAVAGCSACVLRRAVERAYGVPMPTHRPLSPQTVRRMLREHFGECGDGECVTCHALSVRLRAAARLKAAEREETEMRAALARAARESMDTEWDAPAHLTCAITCSLMVEPMCSPECVHAFEAQSIRRWLRKSRTCPQCRVPLKWTSMERDARRAAHLAAWRDATGPTAWALVDGGPSAEHEGSTLRSSSLATSPSAGDGAQVVRDRMQP